VTIDRLAKARAMARTLPFAVDVDELVGVRGLSPAGRTSANGTCRLLPAVDGWVAINLARPSDVDAVPAVVEDAVEDPWGALARYASARRAVDVADRCQLLDIAGSVLEDPRVDATRGVVVHDLGAPGRETTQVVNLSSLWAGPLCAHLLARAGMRVVDVQSTSRQSRTLYPAAERVRLDFESGRLQEVIDAADVVIDASRPRALAQLDIDACAFAARGGTWVSITGYGRACNKVAFGDDAAVAGGLVDYDTAGMPVFFGDAVADPLSGLAAAAAALRSPGGQLIEIAMAAVAKSLC